MEIYNQRPDNCEERLAKEIRVYDLLDELGVQYERIDHEPLMTMEQCVMADQVLGVHICKNLLLCNRQKTQFFLLMLPGDKKFLTKELSKQINSARLSFASGDDMEKYLDILPGSLSVMGLMNDIENKVQLLIDEDILNAKYIGCHPCVNTSCIKMLKGDLIEKVLPAIKHDYISVVLGKEEQQEGNTNNFES